ncbi:hypothetical protein HN51_032151, partial [Arachis hypogaea]
VFVLKSGTWDSLPAPPLSPVDPTLRRAYNLNSPWCQWFVSDDKLFLLAYQPGKEEIVVYDPQSDVWEKVEDKDTHFQLSSFGFDSMSTISVPDVGNNCSVALTFRGENIRGGEFVNIKLYALLLDKQTNLVCCCQSLDECSNEIQVQQSKVWWYSSKHEMHLANPKEPDCLHNAFIVTPKDFSTAFVEQKDSELAGSQDKEG